MDLYILGPDLIDDKVLDTYESFIWVDRYNKCGDFEYYAPVSPEIVSAFSLRQYLEIRESEHIMMVEKILFEYDEELGTCINVSGRSAEFLLDRRIVWGLKVINGSLQDGIETLLNENIINPSDPSRKIDNFIFDPSTDPAITSLTLNAQYTGKNLYEVICDICKKHGLGFKVVLNDNRQFVFSLYFGKDHTYNQLANPYVTFSPEFDNLNNGSYVMNIKDYKNVTLVGGEGEGADRKYASVGSAEGIERREVFTDAKGISSTVEGGTLTNEEYNALLIDQGSKKLASALPLSGFDGEVGTSQQFIYGEDFSIGDVVQTEDEYGHEAASRVSEFITSSSNEGDLSYPTFESIEQEE